MINAGGHFGAAPDDGNGRFAHIDSLRGIACLLVVYIHAVQWGQRSDPYRLKLEAAILDTSVTFLDPGKVGVLLFFAISGFVVPASLIRLRRSSIRAFVVNRAFRIMPAFWLSLLVSLALLAMTSGQAVPALRLAGNAAMAPQLVGHDWLLPVHWSLQVELIFYGLCVLLFLAGLIGRPALPGQIVMALLALAFLGAFARHQLGLGLPVGLALFLSLMFWGFCARQAVDHPELPRLTRQFWSVSLALLLLLPVICWLAYARSPSEYGSWAAYAVSYELAVLIFLRFGVDRPWSRPWLAWVGRVSYSVYLLHLPVIAVAGALVLPFVPDMWAASLVLFPLFVGLTLLASALCFHAVEVPAIRLGRRLNTALDGRRAGAPRLGKAEPPRPVADQPGTLAP